MIAIFTKPETGLWHWQSSLAQGGPFSQFNHALTDLRIAVESGRLDPKAEAAIEALADQQAAEVQAFMEQTGREIDSLLASFGEVSHA